MKLGELTRIGGQELRMAHIEAPLSEAELLLAHVMKKPREYLLTHPEATVTQAQMENFRKLIRRRKEHEPVAYLIGYKDFFGRSFIVDGNVLIPRPETEVLIEQAIEELSETDEEKITVLDVGTGSGVIALTLASELPGSHAVGIDKSPDAIKVAKQNAAHLGVEDRVAFKQLDISFPESPSPIAEKDTYLVLTANLPYLSDMTWEQAPSKIKHYEPMLAFVSGADGLNHYRALMRRLKTWHLTPDLLLLEADPHQFFPLAKLVRRVLPEHRLRIQKDLAGNDRVLIAKKA